MAKMAETKEDFEAIRQIYTVLVLHFVDDMKQSDIALAMNLSPSKVNRLIAQGRRLGMVKISIESPFQPLVDLETRLTKAGFDTGGTDGRVGNDTMKAVKDFQTRVGLPTDGYAGLEVLGRLRAQ